MVKAVVHLLLEREAELIVVGIRNTFFIELPDVVHTLFGVSAKGVVRCR